MNSITTFYLSRIIGEKAFYTNGKNVGIVRDLLVDPDPSKHASGHPLVNGIKIKSNKQTAFYSFNDFHIEKVNGKTKVICDRLTELSAEQVIVIFISRRLSSTIRSSI
jgi:magnesium transporter